MKVIIPAAGTGTRLRPHTYSTPKALLHVAGKPILAHIMDRLLALPELDEIIIVTGFLGDKVREYLSAAYRANIRFVPQEQLRGLGYAIYLAAKHLDGEPALVVLGDTILDTDFSHFIKSGEDVIGVRDVEDPSQFGVVEIVDGRISRLVEKPEKPKSTLAVVGIYGITSVGLLQECLGEIVERGLTTRGEIQVTDALQLMVDRGSVMVPHRVVGWFDCGTVETLLATNRHLLEGFSGTPQPAGSVVIAPSYIAPTAEIVRSVIGPYASIGAGARIVESVIRDCIVGENARVSRMLLENSMIGTAGKIDGTFDHFNIGDYSEIGYQ
jgi:glucose-1-phosphate thymidylyltransferase